MSTKSIPGMGKSGNWRSVLRRLICALASWAAEEEAAEGCRPEASWLVVVVEEEGLSWGSVEEDIVRRGKGEKEEKERRRKKEEKRR